MKKIFVASIAIAAFLLAGCAKNDNLVPADRTVRVSAGAEELITKVASSSTGRFTWQTGDAIGIWTGSELTKFTLDPEWNNFGYGEFVGELPEGGVINENSYAVYPFDDVETATATSVTFKELSNWGIPQSVIRLYSKSDMTATDGKVAKFSFKHCNAYFRVTLKNVRADAGCVFIESTKQFLPKVSTVDFSGDTPVVTVDATNDWTHQVFPAHDKTIESYVLLIPVVPAAYTDDFKFAIKLYSGENFTGNLFHEHYGWFTTPTFNAGELYTFPEITYPNAKVPDDSGTGVNDGIEDSNAIVEGDGFWNVG